MYLFSNNSSKKLNVHHQFRLLYNELLPALENFPVFMGGSGEIEAQLLLYLRVLFLTNFGVKIL